MCREASIRHPCGCVNPSGDTHNTAKHGTRWWLRRACELHTESELTDTDRSHSPGRDFP